MANSLLKKLENIEDLAKPGLSIINEKNATINNIWLYTFSNPYCTAKDVADDLQITSQTARRHLNVLAEKKLLEMDQSKKRNRLYVNYDLMSILS
jgi:predicted ArsR family transcriptional regulator